VDGEKKEESEGETFHGDLSDDDVRTWQSCT
jgi:hypothetical protein